MKDFDFNAVLTNAGQKLEYLTRLAKKLEEKGFENIIILSLVDEGPYDEENNTGGVREYIVEEGAYYANAAIARTYIRKREAHELGHELMKRIRKELRHDEDS
jgi:uncharacterized protein (UPF0297 family)